MKINSIKDLIGNLVEIEPNKSPVLSCFVDFETSHEASLSRLDFEFQMLSRKLAGTWHDDFQKLGAR
jgi:hypothetical protein